jgi:hypothetical protein
MSESDRNRLVACRACGNRVARETRRCPACGTREPTAAAADDPTTPADQRQRMAVPPRVDAPEPTLAAGDSRPPRPAARRSRRALTATLSLLLVLSAAGLTAVHLTTPPVAPPAPSQPEAAPPPVTTAPPEAAVPGPKVVSRSRGRTDWLFFFGPGDWLTRMTDDALLGVVVRVERTHTFADGSRGPAYVVQSMEGEERTLDADELERSARLR